MARCCIMFLFCVAELVHVSAIDRPGFQIRLTQAGLDYANNLALDTLAEEIQSLNLPTIHETAGSFDVTISDLKFSSFPRPNARMTPLEGRGLRWAATELSPVLTANYQFVIEIKIGPFKIHRTKTGTVRASARDLSFTLDFLIGRNTLDGRPTVSVLNCKSGKEGRFRIGFNGDLSTLLNLASGVFNKQINVLANAQICFNARKQIEKHAGYALARMPVSEKFADDKFEINFQLVKFPSFDPGLQLFHKGVVYFDDHRVDPPFEPPAIPEYPNLQERMVYVFVTDYLFNSAAYAAFTNRWLEYNLTATNLPEEARSFLRTSCRFSLCIGTVFSEVADRYPDTEVNMDLRASQTPILSINGDKITLNALGETDLFVYKDDVRHNLFTITVNITGTLQLSVEDIRVHFNVSNLSSTATIKDSNLEEIGTSFFFTSIVRIVTQQFVLPKLNELGEKGFEIPDLEDVRFVNPTVLTAESTPNVFVIGTDVNYEP